MTASSPPWLQPEAAASIARWLDDNLSRPGTGPVSLDPLSGGTSGSVLKLKRDGLNAVLRTIAWPPRPDSERALQREARVLKALGSTSVPHPRFLGFCATPDVLGSPFCVIDFVDGWVGASEPPEPFASDLSLRHATAFAMIDGLVELANVDSVGIGLADFGRPDKFLERQVDRWSGLMDQHRAHPDYGDRTLPGWDEVAEWLRAKVPPMSRVALIHGDVSFSNAMFRNDAPARLAAIIDWEIATIGDPLLDLGRALYPFPARDGRPGYSLAVDLTGYPAREDLAAHYAAKTGLSVALLDYYMVLSMFKLAALIEFNHVKSLREPPGTLTHRLAAFIPTLVAGALEIARASKI
jgi:aminoglycoside phosphotransferase (APT) family kinase protein